MPWRRAASTVAGTDVCHTAFGWASCVSGLRAGVLGRGDSEGRGAKEGPQGAALEYGLGGDAGVPSEAAGTVCPSAHMGPRGGLATYSGNPESCAGQGEAVGGWGLPAGLVGAEGALYWGSEIWGLPTCATNGLGGNVPASPLA